MTELKEATRIMPERRKEIWRAQRARSRLGERWAVRRARVWLMGSLGVTSEEEE